MLPIGERGLRRHLGERVVIGIDYISLNDVIFGRGSIFAFRGILREDEKGFYVEIYKGNGTRESPTRLTNRVRRVWTGDVMNISGESHSIDYYVEVKYERPMRERGHLRLVE